MAHQDDPPPPPPPPPPTGSGSASREPQPHETSTPMAMFTEGSSPDRPRCGRPSPGHPRGRHRLESCPVGDRAPTHPRPALDRRIDGRGSQRTIGRAVRRRAGDRSRTANLACLDVTVRDTCAAELRSSSPSCRRRKRSNERIDVRISGDSSADSADTRRQPANHSGRGHDHRSESRHWPGEEQQHAQQSGEAGWKPTAARAIRAAEPSPPR